MFTFVRNSNCLPKWLHGVAFPPAMSENSQCSIFSPAFGLSVFWILAFLTGMSQDLIIVLICSPLRTYDVEHIFICFFATCTFSLKVSVQIFLLSFEFFVYFVFFFNSFFPIYLYELEANYFTTLQWFLPYINMNRPWIYVCSPF